MNVPRFEIAVIKGDGIGIDVTDAALAVIDAARHRVGGFDLDCQDLLAGAGYFQETGRDMAPGAEEAAAAAAIGEGDDHIAVLGANRKLLILPLADLPVMTRGRGVFLQRYAKGGLADVTALKVADGLTWKAGQQGIRTEPDIKRWIGKRAQAGLVVPKGFSRVTRFS